MRDPRVEVWIGTTGYLMLRAAETGDPKVMYECISRVAGEIDKYITPARLAYEHVTQENEGILS